VKGTSTKKKASFRLGTGGGFTRVGLGSVPQTGRSQATGEVQIAEDTPIKREEHNSTRGGGRGSLTKLIRHHFSLYGSEGESDQVKEG